MMVFCALFFGMAIFSISFFVSRAGNLDRGLLSVFITLIGWSSLLFGIFLARFSPLLP